MAKIYLATYGCTLNQADSDILRALILENYELVDSEDKSDVVVINTCTVKGATENKIFEKMRSLKKANKKFVVAGCLTANVKKIRKLAPNTPIVGTSSLSSICAAVDDALNGRETIYRTSEPKDTLPRVLTSPILRVPINDGCVSKCAFCQTKLARPFLRSYSPKTIVKMINEGVRNDAREIQLTSMDLGAYGIDLRTNLTTLLDSISNDNSSTSAPDKEFLIRLGMINPDHAKRMLSGIVHVLANPKFYKFLHIPVQTGSEKVCREMNRDHTVQDFVDIVTTIRRAVPDTTIATDIIVGYPTETEDDFQHTLKLLQNTKPETVNLSKFSPRPGTNAKELKQLPNDEIKRRSEVASVLVRRIAEEQRKKYIGKQFRVLITERDKNPKRKSVDFKGRTINYTQVVVKSFNGKLGDFLDVEIIDANHGSLFGVPVD